MSKGILVYECLACQKETPTAQAKQVQTKYLIKERGNKNTFFTSHSYKSRF